MNNISPFEFVEDLESNLEQAQKNNEKKEQSENGSASFQTIQPEDLRLNDDLISKLPPVLKNYLNYTSPLSDVPNEFTLTPFLAIAGAVIGNKRYVEVGGNTIYPVVWTVLFAGSTTLRKSTALTLSKKPFKPIQESYKGQHKIDIQKWEDDKEKAEGNGKPFDVPKPKRKTIYHSDSFSDLTFWEDMENNKGTVSTPGEFTALWSELTRPRNSMKDIALSIFDAEDSVRRNTKSAGDIELKNPVWCIAGATTLSNFQRTLTSVERASGLLQRIVPICLEEETKPYKALTELPKPNPELYSLITECTKKLKDLESKSVNYTHKAEQLFTEWSHDLHQRAKALSNRVTDIGGYASRLNVYGLKFGLIFQMLDKPNEPISERNMKAAIALCEWLLNHILYMLDRNYIFNRYYADRLKIRELLEKQPNQKMSRTDLMNMSNFDKKQLDRALSSEIEAGRIEKSETDTGGIKPRNEYELPQAT